MRKDCFNCVEPTLERHTLVLDSDRILKDSSVCEACATAFGEVDWIEVRESLPAEADD